eukprot:CAMPEP_0174322630 /NCGR_PEP_ID=MMETSP0810-20121108/11141_1 /TAXON_ID=73025 ORGANISM="Eutreptiella gymnastica-like, Strain CCMP1594" /NCGR_SAMPLE_ID=MMETSP0810 /ASSEMBLY_ACC=CAM_ASM_000659 /LENGTH=104 /DNA_ID=CAMNT_0015434533 /DNA_START=149 /DNA_END=464 /DNA_ORIENTATION=-
MDACWWRLGLRDVAAITRDGKAQVLQEVLMSWDMFLDHILSLYYYHEEGSGVAQDVSAAAFFKILHMDARRVQCLLKSRARRWRGFAAETLPPLTWQSLWSRVH